VAHVEAGQLAASDGVGQVELMAAGDVLLAAYSEELAFDGVL